MALSPQEGSARASEFVPLITSNTRRIYTYLLTLVPNRADAEEIFQEVCLLLWERFDEFEPGSHFGAWACRIAYFKVLKFWERDRQRPALFSDSVIEVLHEEVIAMDDSADLEYQALAECFKKLSQGDREMIALRYSNEGAPQRLATILHRPVKSIYRSLERIHFALLECVTRRMAIGE